MTKSKFQFVNPYLEELKFCENKAFERERNSAIEVKNTFNVHIERREENSAKVQLILNMNAENENAPFQLKAVVASEFRWEELEDKAVEDMLNLNAPALLLGYMRPIVANITNVSSFPVYNLPFINFKM